jgi:gliding motility-associated-like protein
MKTIYSLMMALAMLLQYSVWAQGSFNSTIDSLQNFDENTHRNYFLQHHADNTELYNEFITSKKRDYIQEVYYSSNREIGPPPSVQAACTNMDFESGDLTGWTRSTGFNPAYDPQGCCINTGGAQVVTGGAGNDGCANFPVVCPGGNFSVRIGNNAVNGVADRLEQTFSVTQANANYTYKYAVVLEDPGHIAAEQPSFQIDMLDANGVQIPCTFYQVSAGQGIPGFINSTNCAGVIYKPWTTVSVDLSAYIGQDVTIRFTTYDCALGGHFAYAYIDGSCLAYTITQMDSLCVGSTTQICAPDGFQTYTWSGPGIVNQNANCITVANPGVYSVQLTSVTGCQSPVINYQVSNHPTPIADFNVVGGNNSCNLTVAFDNNSSISNTNQLNYMWDFGDGTTSFMEQPSHTYLTYGTYVVTLITTSVLTGCSDTTVRTLTIDNPPTPIYTGLGGCAGSFVSFVNQTQNLVGNESWLWNFGDNTFDSQQSAVHLYPVAGTYNVSLTVTTINGCSANTAGQVTISPLPVANFSGTNVCLGQLSVFTDLSTVSSGSINSWEWDFDNNGSIDNLSQNPAYAFNTAGLHDVELFIQSNNGCLSSFNTSVYVYPNPQAAFSTSNVCVNFAATFQNTSSIATPSQIQSYAWNFGDASSSNLMNPNHQFANAGTYNVSLTATSEAGCINTFVYPIIVFPVPTASFVTVPVCVTQATQFTDQSMVNGGTIIARNWDFNNDGTIDATNPNPTYVYPNAGMQNAKLETITNNGCSNQTINVVVVHETPTAQFAAQSSCLGLPTVFLNNSTSSDGAIVSYAWDYTSDGTIDNVSADPIVTLQNFGSYLATLEIQTEFGCEATYQKNIRIHPLPSVQFTASTVAGCPSLCVDFTNNVSIAQGTIASYLWNFGGQNSGSNLPNASFCFDSGTYDVSLTAVSDSGCATIQTTQSMINVYQTPIANFSVAGEDMDVINPEVEIGNLAIGANQITYSVSDGFTTHLSDFTYLFSNETAQDYTITQFVSNSNGCVDSISRVLEIKPAFTFYIPNAFSPNEDGINDHFKGDGIGINEYRMWVFDRWGNMIFYSEKLDHAWDGTFQGKSDKVVMQDVYVWKVELKDVFSKKHDYHGTVSVVK